MAYEVTKVDNLGPETLFRLLERKHLLSLQVRENPAILVPAVMEADFYAFVDGDRVGAYLMETRCPTPGTLDLTLIPEDKTLCLHAEELSGLSGTLRKRWFEDEGWDKVQASVPKSRKNACRTLAAMGFVCETRSMGIRNGVHLGKEPEGVHIYGLLATDPIPEVIHAEA